MWRMILTAMMTRRMILPVVRFLLQPVIIEPAPAPYVSIQGRKKLPEMVSIQTAGMVINVGYSQLKLRTKAV
jgi:hypothetical protein